MLDVKKLLTKILVEIKNKKPRLTAGSAVSFPFAPTSDGFVTVKASVPTTSASYAIFLDSGNNFVGSGFSTGGTSWATTFPVLQGRTYTLSASSNANLSYTYYALY